MFQKVFEVLRNKWRSVLLILVVAVFPLYTMSTYFANNDIWQKNLQQTISSLKLDAEDFESSAKFAELNSADTAKVETLAVTIFDLSALYEAKDYQAAAIVFNQLKAMLENYQGDDELRAFINNQMSVTTLPQLNERVAFNVWPLNDVIPSSASLFGFVGALDYFYYFMTHNTYIIWVLIIIFKFDYVTSQLKEKGRTLNLRKHFIRHWTNVIISYISGLAIFLLGLILVKGVGNPDIMVSYFSQSQAMTIHMPYLYLSLAQLFYHLLVFGLILSMIMLFSVLTHNQSYTLVLTCIVCSVLFFGMSSSVASFNPFTYTDLLSNIHSGTNYHFLDPNNKILIKDTGSLLKGLVVNIIPMILLIKSSKILMAKQFSYIKKYNQEPLSD